MFGATFFILVYVSMYISVSLLKQRRSKTDEKNSILETTELKQYNIHISCIYFLLMNGYSLYIYISTSLLCFRRYIYDVNESLYYSKYSFVLH